MQWTDFLLIGLLFAVVMLWLGFRAVGPEKVQGVIRRFAGPKLREWFVDRLDSMKAATSREKRPSVTKLPPEALTKQSASDEKKKSVDSSRAAAESLKRFLGR